jgi:hypothetical protein
MFGTVLNYVSLRLLGVDREVPAMTEARTWIEKHGPSPISCFRLKYTADSILVTHVRRSWSISIMGTSMAEHFERAQMGRCESDTARTLVSILSTRTFP